MKRLFTLLFLLLCLFTQALAENTATRTIRVGFPAIPGFNEVNKDGTFSGYNPDYLKKIAQQTNWKYEFVIASWKDCIDMLKTGKIDMMGGLEQTPEREKLFNYARLESFLNTLSLLARADDDRFLRKNLNEYKNLTVGVIKGSVNTESLKQYSRENSLTFRLKEYNDIGHLNAAFKKKDIDILLASGMNKLNGQQTLVTFSPTPLFYAVRKNAPDILAELNEAQSRIKSQDRFIDYRLYEKHYGFSESNRPTLTKTERQALQDMPPMRVAFVHGWRPIAYKNDDRQQGVVADLFASIASSSGLRVHYEDVNTHEDAVNLLQSGKADTIAFIALNNELADRDDLKLSVSFLQVPLTMLIKNDRDRSAPIRKIGISHIMNKQFVENLLQHNPTIETIVRKSPFELCKALASGELDAVYVNTYSANSFLSWPQFSSLASYELADYTIEFAVAFSSGTDPNVISAFNKYIRQLRTYKMHEFAMANTAHRPKSDLFSLIRQEPVKAFYLFAFILLLTVGTFSYIIISRSRSHRKIADLLYYDQLTRLPNLVKFNEQAKQQLKIGTASHALIYININNFKHINDMHDYSKGDSLLCAVAAQLTTLIDVNSGELACRSTADHFVLLLSFTDRETFSERIRILDRKLADLNETGLNFHLSFSCGIYLIKENDTINTAVNYAHYAQVTQKHASYNTLTFFDDKLIQHIRDNRVIEKQMTGALENGQFVPYLQPKVSLATGKIVGAEALTRWLHPERGLIPPDEFIPLFEKNNFIIRLDLAMFEAVCKLQKKLMDDGKKVYPFSCNFSHNHFMDHSLPDKLLSIAMRNQVPTNLLDIEITESAVIYDVNAVIDVARKLREAGFKISLDDFGVGYSSVSLLCQIEVDTIKLDKSFLDHESILPCKRILIEGIIDTARTLGIDVLCEGVETAMQAVFLKNAGCKMAQGFHFGRPVPFDEFSRQWLNRHEQDIVLVPFDNGH